MALFESKTTQALARKPIQSIAPQVAAQAMLINHMTDRCAQPFLFHSAMLICYTAMEHLAYH